ncbi:tRNA-dihydrouridine synthase A (fragment) [Xenorhabdus bovienii str. puntauvense]|uniref:tRNA-dihydrouridine synthase A n=1 Tax=Xenorhabdus bovienii str. puntauvense TaxID=1398201 RepID=A0A077NEA7_XENBV
MQQNKKIENTDTTKNVSKKEAEFPLNRFSVAPC